MSGNQSRKLKRTLNRKRRASKHGAGGNTDESVEAQVSATRRILERAKKSKGAAAYNLLRECILRCMKEADIAYFHKNYDDLDKWLSLGMKAAAAALPYECRKVRPIDYVPAPIETADSADSSSEEQKV